MKLVPIRVTTFIAGALPASAESRTYDVPEFNAVSVSAGVAAVI